MDLIGNAINEADIDKIREEVIPFVTNVRVLDIWSKEFFRAASERITVE